MPRTATVKRLTFPEGRRVLAISDIHGNLPFLKGVLAAAHYGPDDILVLVGDLVEKGPGQPHHPPVHHGAGGAEHGVLPEGQLR